MCNTYSVLWIQKLAQMHMYMYDADAYYCASVNTALGCTCTLCMYMYITTQYIMHVQCIHRDAECICTCQAMKQVWSELDKL